MARLSAVFTVWNEGTVKPLPSPLKGERERGLPAAGLIGGQ